MVRIEENKLLKLAAFSDGDEGGNPAGVHITDKMPSDAEMLAIAADIGYSETAFLEPMGQDNSQWRVRYFSPKVEVPFCGHVTIALTAALAEHTGQNHFALQLNEASITTSAAYKDGHIQASFVSPETSSRMADHEAINAVCHLFGLSAHQLDKRLEPAFISAGAEHFLLALKHRSDLADMEYDFDQGVEVMTKFGMFTIMLVWREASTIFHVRNAFAFGGVVEDPATGAAAAALTGHLNKLGELAGDSVSLIQGEDMGMRSVIHAKAGAAPGDGVTVSGSVRRISG